MPDITISGMRCGHCAEAVSKALNAVPGLHDITIDLEQGLARCQGAAADEDIRRAIQAIGFEVTEISEG
ncbi:MAG: hypothetical protein BWK76_15345 [Desulfobulbaceae bacterium A2]|nr:MAG: hypothetical protein BWK76_15345 [Desulfobulbaceae bacterium A2]